jgi:hypothetical protein
MVFSSALQVSRLLFIYNIPSQLFPQGPRQKGQGPRHRPSRLSNSARNTDWVVVESLATGWQEEEESLRLCFQASGEVAGLWK